MNLLLIAVSIVVKGVSFSPMEVERLPEMNIPRQAHSLHCAGGEYTVIGGHTTGFVPTATAEYYRGGKWHTVNTLYPHDAGFSTQLKNGDILTGGGYTEAFGIGQTWGVEVYHPATHRFSHLPILDHKRTHATAIEMADGRILVAGNWFAPDILEGNTAGETFEQIKEVSCQRNLPFLLQVSPDNAFVFSATDNYGNPLTDGWVEQLNGEPFQERLLQEWTTENAHMPNPPEHYTIGEYRYLIPSWKADTLAILQLDSGRFALLETNLPIPLEGPWGAIEWQHGLSTEATSQSAWKQGRDAEGRLYLLRIGYGESPAAVQVFYSDPLEDLPYKAEALALSGGRVLLAGGVRADSYDAQGTVLLCYTQGKPHSVSYWLGLILGSLAGILLCLLGWRLSRKKASAQAKPEKEFPDLQAQVVRLMEEEELFRKKDLRVADFATRLHTNTTYISATLNSGLGMSFPRFVTSYRIRYAQEQMRLHPDIKLSVVSEEAGFTNENSFFRTFRAETGLTPTEWREKQTS